MALKFALVAALGHQPRDKLAKSGKISSENLA